MIEITDNIVPDEREIEIEFMRSSGPGGQNVNKVETGVQLRFDLNNSSLPENIILRLRRIAKGKISSEGILIIKSIKYRTQVANKRDALNRLLALLKRAAQKPKKRIKTIPTEESKIARREKKEHQSRIKEMRKPIKDMPEE